MLAGSACTVATMVLEIDDDIGVVHGPPSIQVALDQDGPEPSSGAVSFMTK